MRHYGTMKKVLIACLLLIGVFSGSAKGSMDLLRAAYEGDLAKVERLVRAGVDVNHQSERENGGTALMVAAGQGHGAVVERLVRAGADVNRQDKDGETALVKAAGPGHGAVVERLVRAGADVNRQGRAGHTPLMVAAAMGHGAVVERLIRAGADVNRQSKTGFTPLMVAAGQGHGAIVERLVRAGADVNRQSKAGHTALDLAAGQGHTVIVAQLKSAAQEDGGYDRSLAPQGSSGLSTPSAQVDQALENAQAKCGRPYQGSTDPMDHSRFQCQYAFFLECEVATAPDMDMRNKLQQRYRTVCQQYQALMTNGAPHCPHC